MLDMSVITETVTMEALYCVSSTANLRVPLLLCSNVEFPRLLPSSAGS